MRSINHNLVVDFDFESHKELVSMKQGDVPTTYADASTLERDFGFTPRLRYVRN